MFRTDLLSVIRSLTTVYAAIGICHASYVDSSPNIVRVIKSRRMRWAGRVACMGVERGVYRVLVGKPEGRRPLGRPRWLILGWICGMWVYGLDWAGSG